MKFILMLTLLSDTTFARGDGVSGVVDEEIEYDSATGLPYVRGRTLKGLLTEECANLLYGLERANAPGLARLQAAASRLFGEAGSEHEGAGLLHVGAALLPDDVQQAVREHIQTRDHQKKLTPAEVLDAYTVIRRQTANDLSGAPALGSLRSARAVIRGTVFNAVLSYNGADDDRDAVMLLAACVVAVHRAGSTRNRGRGRLAASLHAENVDLASALTDFEGIARGQS